MGSHPRQDTEGCTAQAGVCLELSRPSLLFCPPNRFTRNLLSRSPSLTLVLVEVDNPHHQFHDPTFPLCPCHVPLETSEGVVWGQSTISWKA